MTRPLQPILAAWRDTYDRLGFVVCTNMVFVLVVALVLGILPIIPRDIVCQVPASVCAVIAVGPLLYGLYAAAASVARREDACARRILAGFGRRSLTATTFAGLNGAVYWMGTLTIGFWLRSPSHAFAAIGCVWAWLLLIWSVAQCYAMPILATQSLGVWASERVALYLVLRRPGVALAMTAYMLAFAGAAGVAIGSGVGFLAAAVVLFASTITFAHLALVHTHATLRLIDDESAGTATASAEPEPHTESGG